MSEPIQIIITAQTAQAVAEIHRFVSQSGGELQSMAKTFNEEAEKTSEHIAGMSYYFRSGIDSIRYAAAGGGTRAAFYSIDELVRGLVSSGMSLSRLLPILGGVGAAVGLGYLAWYEYSKAEREVAEEAKNLSDALEKIPQLLKDIQTAKEAGALSPAKADKYQDYLSGQTPLYVHGNDLQESPVFKNPHATRLGAASANLTQATPSEVVAWVEKQEKQDKLTNDGKFDPRINARAELQKEFDKSDEMSSSGLTKQTTEIQQRYQAEIDKIKDTLLLTETLATARQKELAADKIQNLQAAESAEIAAAQEKFQVENQAKLKEKAAAQDAIMEQQITANAQREGVKRTDNVNSEYYTRVATARIQLAAGLITENEYSAKVTAATGKWQEGQKAVNAELQRTAALQQEISRAQVEAKLKAIEGNPFLNKQEKAQQSIPLYAQQASDNLGDIGALQKFQTSTNDDAAKLDAQKRINDLLVQNVELKEKMDSAAGQSSFAFQFGTQLHAIQDQWGSWAIQFASDFKSLGDSMSSSVSHNFAQMIEGTKSWGQATHAIGKAMRDDMIQTFTQMATDFLIKEQLMTLLHIAGEEQRTLTTSEAAEERNLISLGETIFHALQVAARTIAHVAGEFLMTAVSVAQSAIRIGVILAETFASLVKAAIEALAAMASIPYVGPVLGVAAMAAILAAGEGVIGGFYGGGYTGSGPRGNVAGVVHNEEFVVPANVVDRVGVDNLNAMVAGGGTRGGGAANNSGTPTKITNQIQIAHFGGEADAQRWADSQAGEVWMHDQLNKKVYLYTQKS